MNGKRQAGAGEQAGSGARVPLRPNSAWPAAQVEAFLATAVLPLRLAGTMSGAPLICSLWFLYEDGCLWCATGPRTAMARAFRRDAACGFELAPNEPPYYGIRGQGTVTLDSARGPDMLVRLIERYLGRVDTPFARWLIDRSQGELALCIEPRWITAWDYTARMRQAVSPDAGGAGN